MSGDANIFGLPGAEQLHDSIDAVVAERTRWADPEGPDELTVTVEEWTVHPPRRHLPDVEGVLDQIAYLCEDSGVNETDENWYEDLLRSMKRPEVHAAAEVLLVAVADGIRYRMADAEVATHEVVAKIPKPPPPCCWNCSPAADATGKPRVQPPCPICGQHICPRANSHHNTCTAAPRPAPPVTGEPR